LATFLFTNAFGDYLGISIDKIGLAIAVVIGVWFVRKRGARIDAFFGLLMLFALFFLGYNLGSNVLNNLTMLGL